MDFLSVMPMYYNAGNFKTMGMQLGGIDDKRLTIIGSLGSLANGGSRIIIGLLQDKIGFSKVYLGVLVLEFLVCTLITTIV